MTPSNEVEVLAKSMPDLDRPLDLAGGLTLSEAKTIGQLFYQSGMFTDLTSAAQAVTKVLAGQELGIPPMQAMQGYHVIKGQPRLSASLIAALVKRSGRYDYRVREANDTLCRLEWYQEGESVGESMFTLAEAQAADIAGGANWKKYAEDMLFARALTRGARRYCPDVFGGAVYTLGEDPEDEATRPEPVRMRLPSLRSSRPSSTAAESSPSGSSPESPLAPDGDHILSSAELEDAGQTRFDDDEIPG